MGKTHSVSLQYFGIDDGHTVLVLDLCVFNLRHVGDVVVVDEVGVGNEGVCAGLVV
jgi:hypothetical protein